VQIDLRPVVNQNAKSLKGGSLTKNGKISSRVVKGMLQNRFRRSPMLSVVPNQLLGGKEEASTPDRAVTERGLAVTGRWAKTQRPVYGDQPMTRIGR